MCRQRTLLAVLVLSAFMLRAVASAAFALPTTTAVVTSGSPSFIQAEVTFTATVSSTYGSIPDGEIVTFYDGTAQIGSAVTAGGVSALSTSALAAGRHSIRAIYAGDPTFKPSSGTVSQVVNLYPTTVTFTTTPNPSVYGQTVSLGATVSSNAPGGPTGSITFRHGPATLGTVALSSGSAVLLTATLPVGSELLAAAYSGDALSSKSTATTTQQVGKASSSTGLTSSADPSNSGLLVMFTATVSSAAGTPTGSVIFADGATELGKVSLTGGTASFGASTLASGVHAITATYGGDANFSGSTSSADPYNIQDFKHFYSNVSRTM